MNKTAFINGVKRGFPIAVGYFPIAIAFGALAIEANLSTSEAVLMSVFVFAGASQFVAAGMILAGASAVQIVAATFFLNLRHLIMSMAVNDRLKGISQIWRMGLSFGITDETFALLTLQDTNRNEHLPRLHVAGLLLTAYLGWVTGTAVGCVSVQVIPPGISAGMSMGLYAMFIGLLVPQLRKSARIAAIALASMLLSAVFHRLLESGWAIVSATVLGALVGALIIDIEEGR
jgi:4-azaleucine resistance transporter AzlC